MSYHGQTFTKHETFYKLLRWCFFYRVPADKVVIDLITEAKRLDIVSIFDVDDLVFDRERLSQNLNIQKLDRKTQKMLLKGADLYQEALKLCDHSTASTRTLGQLMQKHTQGNNTLIPNCLDKELLDYQKLSETMASASSKDTDTIKIVYGSGTSTHDIDFLEVSDALVYILQKYPHVALIIHGTLTLAPIFKTGITQRTNYANSVYAYRAIL
ncbi:MAG: hypothetical protein Q9M36_08265 [Sulfurovum sp.]|nr:hypothetical protein [Sulfurovum sp.]